MADKTLLGIHVSHSHPWCSVLQSAKALRSIQISQQTGESVRAERRKRCHPSFMKFSLSLRANGEKAISFSSFNRDAMQPCGAGNHWSKPVGAMMGEGQADTDAGRSDSQQHAAEPFVKVLSDSKGIESISHCLWKGDWPPGGHFSISEPGWCVAMGKRTLSGWHMFPFQPSLSSAAVRWFNYEWESWDLTVFHIRALVWTPNGSSPPRFKLLLLWQSTCQEFIS